MGLHRNDCRSRGTMLSPQRFSLLFILSGKHEVNEPLSVPSPPCTWRTPTRIPCVPASPSWALPRSASPQWKAPCCVGARAELGSRPKQAETKCPSRMHVHVHLHRRSMCSCMVWYDICQCNCKSHLHHPFSSSETSFEFSLLEEARMSSHSDMLHAFHSLASVCVANHQPGPTPLPWLSSSRIKIVKPDLQVQLCPR